MKYPLSRTAFRAKDVENLVASLSGVGEDGEGGGGGGEGGDGFESQYDDLLNDSDVEVIDSRLAPPPSTTSTEEGDDDKQNEEKQNSTSDRQRKTLTLEAAILRENKGKNRYKNILPFDQTRVKLGRAGGGDEEEDETDRKKHGKKRNDESDRRKTVGNDVLHRPWLESPKARSSAPPRAASPVLHPAKHGTPEFAVMDNVLSR